MERDACIQSLLLHISRSPQKQSLLVKTKSHHSLKVSVKEPPPFSPQRSSYGQRCSFSRASGLLINSYLSEPLVKELSHETGGNMRSPSTELHPDGMPTYNVVQTGSPRGLFSTPLLLPQCRAAFSTLHSTLAWVDQSLVSQRVYTRVTASNVTQDT